VAGGNVTLFSDVVQSSTFPGDPAISLTGGTLDLGTAASPGNNIINANGSGQLIQNTTGNAIAATGDTFESNNTPLPATASLSFTSLTSSATADTYGQTPTLTATVQGNGTSTTPTGSVDFFDTTTNTYLGSVALSGGVAMLTPSTLGVGTHVIEAIYGG